MKAITKQPGQPSKVEDMGDDTLAWLQAKVEGYITTVYAEALDAAGVTCWANDEGLLIGQAPNLLVYGQPIVGPVVFTGHDDEGETVGLTEAQEKAVAAFLKTNTLSQRGATLLALRMGVL